MGKASNLEHLKGRECFAGLDPSSTTDITAFVLVFPPKSEEEKYERLNALEQKADVYIMIEVVLSESEWNLYRKLEKEMLLPFEDGDIDAIKLKGVRQQFV